jgi:signal transduction histidine kinase
MLQEFIELYRDEIIKRCRAKVAQRSIPPPTEAAIDHGVPLFLSQMADALRPGAGSTMQINQSAVLHGHDLLRQGFTVSQVVHGYGDVCQTVTELALETNTPIETEDFRTLNRCLDEAIAGAVTEFGRERQQSDVAGESARGSERLGFFAHELRNLTNTAIFAFEVLKTGDVGIAGTTGRVLQRSLIGLRTLIARSLEEVRFTQGPNTREPLLVSGLIEDVAHAAALEASAKGVTFIVAPTEDGVFVNADRLVLAAALTNLLQNAVKFTRHGTTVTLRSVLHMDRVLIEVEDECGGLPDGEVSDLFRPFTQRSSDRSGVGLGLAFARWASEANQGQLVSHNVPGKGCIFTINLPRVTTPANVMA